MAFLSIVLFLVGITWWIELGGLEKEQLSFLAANNHLNQTTLDYMDRGVVRFKVDIPDSGKAPPLAAVAPLLDTFSSMGFSLISHNDEYKQNLGMVYLTWMLQREIVTVSPSPPTEADEEVL